jgi:hypothetical protein
VHQCYGCTFRDLVLDDNYRQACSVISTADTLFDNCQFLNTGMTGGTAPQAGVDFEPNGAYDFLVNLTLRNCLARNNVGGGFFLSYSNLNNKSKPLSILFENCTVDGAGGNLNYGLNAYALPGYPDNKTNSVSGSITWRGGSISNSLNSAICFNVPLGSDMRVLVEDTVVNGSLVRSAGPFATSPVVVGIWPGTSNEGLRKPSGQVIFRNITVIDAISRPFFLSNTTTRHVHGDFIVHNPRLCNASLSAPCDGCPSPTTPASRDVEVKFRCAPPVTAQIAAINSSVMAQAPRTKVDDRSAPIERSQPFPLWEAGYVAYWSPGLAVVPNKDGNKTVLIAFAEGRTNCADFTYHDLVCKRSFDGGRTWSPICGDGGLALVNATKLWGLAAAGSYNGTGNATTASGSAVFDPTPVYDHTTGVVFLLFQLSPWKLNTATTQRKPGHAVFIMSSSDAGVTTQPWAVKSFSCRLLFSIRDDPISSII